VPVRARLAAGSFAIGTGGGQGFFSLAVLIRLVGR